MRLSRCLVRCGACLCLELSVSVEVEAPHSSHSQMKVVTLAVLAAVLLAGAAGELPPPERSYKILMLLPFSSKSHRNVFIPLAEALADRGHKIVMLSGLPPAFKNPNIHEINHELPYMDTSQFNMFEMRKKGVAAMGPIQNILPPFTRELYKLPAVKQLYEKRKDFDLIVVNSLFNEVAFPFVHEVPFITLATPGLDPSQSAVLGNVLNPSYVPSLLMGFPFPMSLWQRVMNTVMHVFQPVLWRHWALVPVAQKEISALFPDLPPLLEIERNQSLTLMNTHFSISTTVPLLPSQVEVGAMHCRPAKPLPEDLESWISGAGAAGVIYFSLGSVARSETMPLEYRQAFLEAFRRLPQRVIWKYEGELEGASDNVMISSWLPQQDILGHDNVKVFITHGGLLSLQESIFHAKPLLSLPIAADQPKNGQHVEDSGMGRMLIWEELTADRIVDALTDIITNAKYRQTVSAMSASLRDQLTTPKETAVFWTEYVIRHQGAPQLRCPAAQLSWVEYLLLDVAGILLLALLLLLLLLRRLLRAASALVFGGSVKKKKE